MNKTAYSFLEPTPTLPEWPGVRLFFTNRQGGVSQNQYSSLNLGQHVADQPDHVAVNRQRLLTALDLPADRLWLLSQVHGNKTIIASGTAPVQPMEGDALVTQEPHLALGILTADCAPVLLIDPVRRIVGAAHAGWRGALNGILESCVAAMATLGSDPQTLSAVIGPCIRQPAFEVGGEVKAFFCDQYEKNSRFFLPIAASFADKDQQSLPRKPEEGKFLLDLSGYIRDRLVACGLGSQHIHDLQLCTYHEDRFFSHRRSTQHGTAPCGRQVSGVQLLETR